jgi:transcriptional regulator with XRE-family HTH domain
MSKLKRSTKHLSEFLRSARKKRGLSQEEAILAFGFTRMFLWSIETGRFPFPESRIKQADKLYKLKKIELKDPTSKEKIRVSEAYVHLIKDLEDTQDRGGEDV